MLKIGLDIHGVMTDHPNQNFFPELTRTLVEAGHEVHVLSGPSVTKIKEELALLGITYTHLFSIEDYHLNKGTHYWRDEAGNIFMDDSDWDKTKGKYCLDNKIDFHLDDSDTYNYHFKTPYSRFYSKNKRKHHLPTDNKPSVVAATEKRDFTGTKFKRIYRAMGELWKTVLN